MTDGRVAAQPKVVGTQALPKPIATSRAAAGVLLFAFGLPLWIAGARYTFDGWLVALNWFLGWIGIPLTIPPIPASLWYLRLALMAALGLAYSRVETRPPLGRLSSKRASALLVLWLLFGLVIASDVGTTFVGVRASGPNAWPLTTWVAQTLPVASAWIAFLTFVPDWMLIVGWRLLFRR